MARPFNLLKSCNGNGLDNPVRIVDVFVNELELAELGFEGVTPHRQEDLATIHHFF
ncbi:MAG: hypothetical protein DID92_2727744134 [Candidatus Nitrotoga sp. SPKER]|nr:MAG: hypothetical protein DID92_2727744134 [Candidatus Nitrotoga sp. SPKER]